jgi:uncharacterized protein YndB with AHSA1/START domain
MEPFTTARRIEAPVVSVFAAISTPERLATWWGPKGFRNEVTECVFADGGRWLFTMVGPDGARYANECRFVAIDAPARVVIEHVNGPAFVLTITLTGADDGAATIVVWEQAFADPAVAAQVAVIVIPANEENLDRLTEEVLRPTG